MAIFRRACPDQALALAVRPLGVLFGNRRDARHAAMAPFPAPPPQEPALEQLGVEPVGLGPAMLPRYRDTRGMDHVRFDPARIQPTRQPEAIAAGFEGQCNPRDLFTGPDRFIAPAMPQAKKPFRTRFQLLLRLTLNAGKHPGNQPARLAHLDDGIDCAILVQGDEGPAQVVQLGHRGTPSVICQRRWCHLLRRLPHTISPLEEAGFSRSTGCGELITVLKLTSVPARTRMARGQSNPDPGAVVVQPVFLLG